MNKEETIQIYKYRCLICKKEYTRKTSLDKHKLLCDYKSKSKSELITEDEEIGDKPSYDQLVKIVQELSIKYGKMETKLDDLQQWIARRKKKQDVISWLNANINATVGFLEWVTMLIEVNAKHFDYLMENNIFQTYHCIFDYNLRDTIDIVYPISCFKDKPNTFYICEKGEQNDSVWRQMEPTEFMQLIKRVHNLLICELTKWKQNNRERIEDNDKLSEVFNKAVIKLMGLTFVVPDGVGNVNKIRNLLYNLPQLTRNIY